MRAPCRFILGITLVGCLLLAGCASHYRVVDPTTDREYYTKSYDELAGGAVRLIDARTGRVVTLQTSEIQKISREYFQVQVDAAEEAQDD